MMLSKWPLFIFFFIICCCLQLDVVPFASNPHVTVTKYATHSNSYFRRSLLLLKTSPPTKIHIPLPPPPKHHSSRPHKHTPPSHVPAPSPSPSPSFLPHHNNPSSHPLKSLSHPHNSPSPSPPHISSSHTPKSPSLSLPPTSSYDQHSHSKHRKIIIWASISAASALLIIAPAAFLICRTARVSTVKPWSTGLSGQLQRAFVSGVPKLKRSELELACEDFSNIIGSLADGTVYKGTLSTGIEIAVVTTSLKSAQQWSTHLERQYRNKIETLSKVNHKNFVNLIGYCEEDNPFTRMMVFEYAPNGTLFEHLHVKEAERLDWSMRLRIIMGMAYSLQYMHQLESPIPHRDLHSSAIYLSEDYAAKISDFSFWNEATKSKMRSPSMQLWEATSTDIETNVFNFGLVLFEIITGRIPYADDDCTVAEWILDFLEKDQLPPEYIDPTLTSYSEDEVQKLFYVIKECLHPEPSERPSMREVTTRLRKITGMGPDGACPRLSPLWWAELEILSTEGS